MINTDITKMSPDEAVISLISLTAEKNILKKAVFSKPTDRDVLRMVATLKVIGKKQMLQAEYFMRDNKAIHKNIDLSALSEALFDIVPSFSQINIISTAGDCELRRSKSGKSTLIGGAKLLTAINKDNADKVEITMQEMYDASQI